MSKLSVLDLFSGIGGFSLGLERTGGFQTVAFCEIEPFCRRVLAKHWPGVPCYDDVRQLTADRLSADGICVDVICGGFPCQDISLSGRGEGLAGARSGLWSEIARLVGELRPRYVIVENVSALLGRGLGTVLGNLAALGYDAEWDCIPAAVFGSRQLRDRIWIVATPGSVEHARSERSRGLCGSAEVRRRASVSRIRSVRDGTSWATEPRVDRVAYGIPGRVDRLRSLGNTVLPDIPEAIGNAILASLAQQEAA